MWVHFLTVRDDEIAMFSIREEVLLPKAAQAAWIFSLSNQWECP